MKPRHEPTRLALTLLLSGLARAACGDRGSEVEVDEAPIASDWAEIAGPDSLVGLMQFNSTGYFIYRGEPMGFEHDVLRAFAEANDLAFRVEVLDDRAELINRLGFVPEVEVHRRLVVLRGSRPVAASGGRSGS